MQRLRLMWECHVYSVQLYSAETQYLIPLDRDKRGLKLALNLINVRAFGRDVLGPTAPDQRSVLITGGVLKNPQR